jgi:mannose-1-phosphate guanylyltransferase
MSYWWPTKPAHKISNTFMLSSKPSKGHDAHKLHSTVHRPWGTYTVLEEGEGFKIKRIQVKPGASLSLQMHRYRSEY